MTDLFLVDIEFFDLRLVIRESYFIVVGMDDLMFFRMGYPFSLNWPINLQL